MKIILFILIAFTTQMATAQKSDISWLKGSWEGTGYQPNTTGDQNWDIELKYYVESENFVIRYPSLSCGGNWKLVKANRKSAEFIETIVLGTDKCTNQLTVLVEKINKDKVKVTFYAPNSTVIDATGILTRKL